MEMEQNLNKIIISMIFITFYTVEEFQVYTQYWYVRRLQFLKLNLIFVLKDTAHLNDSCINSINAYFISISYKHFHDLEFSQS